MRTSGLCRAAERSAGVARLAGVDEVGRGALAGPVVAAACVWPFDEPPLEGIRDSKTIGARRREALFDQIMSNPRVAVAVGVAGPEEVDRVDVLQATMAAMSRAVAGLPEPPELVLVDGNRCPAGLPCPSRHVVRGDATCYSIAAASIVAKVTRDRLMTALHAEHPELRFDVHFGYGTARHMQAMREHGDTPHHRKSFNPMRSWLAMAAIAGMM